MRRRTVSSVDLGGGAGCFAHEDGRVWVVLLHGRIGAREECPACVMINISSSSLDHPCCGRPGIVIARDGVAGGDRTHLVAALVSPWLNKKRTSFRAFVKAYLLDMFAVLPAGAGWFVGGRVSGC